MSRNQEEADYCASRIARSTSLALASTDCCARAAHTGIAAAYGKRLAALTAGQVLPLAV